jgi:hypothetical protein
MSISLPPQTALSNRKMQNTSKIFHSTVVKLAIECANKMMSSITMKSETNVRPKNLLERNVMQHYD